MAMALDWLLVANNEIWQQVGGVAWYFFLVLVNSNKYRNKPALHIVAMRRSKGENSEAFQIRERKEKRAYTKAYLLPLILVSCGFIFKFGMFVASVLGIGLEVLDSLNIWMNTWLALIIPILITLMTVLFDIYLVKVLISNDQ